MRSRASRRVESVRRAAARTETRLLTRGWRQGAYGNRRAGYCLVGAARADAWRHPLAYLRLMAELDERGPLGRQEMLQPASWRERERRARNRRERVIRWNDWQLTAGPVFRLLAEVRQADR